MINRYGVEAYSQTNECKEKVKQTNLQKYGVENYSQSIECKEKYKQTILEKYGVEYYSQTNDFKEKLEKTMLNKYGKYYKQTCLKKYGVEHHMQVEEIKNKIIIQGNKTMYKNGTGICTKQQEYICNLLKGKLNYPIDRIRLDIAFPGEMIYIKYDGGGHNLSVKCGWKTNNEFNNYEIKRNLYLKKLGWKEIRIISDKDLLPQDKQILELINNAKEYLLNSNHIWYKINIDKKQIECSQYIKKINLNNLRKIK